METWTKEAAKDLLETDDRMVLRGMVAIYKKQTDDEQMAHQTIEDNGVGFNGFDAEILTSFAEQVIEGRRLSAKQFDIARRRIMKYAGQLADIANKGGAK